jgi:hypothetical protein
MSEMMGGIGRLCCRDKQKFLWALLTIPVKERTGNRLVKRKVKLRMKGVVPLSVLKGKSIS